MPAPVNEDEDEALKRAVAMSLEEQSRIAPWAKGGRGGPKFV